MAAKSPSELAGETPVTVRSVFERPRYDKVMDPCDYAKKWLEAQDSNLRGFVDGKLLLADKGDAHIVAVKSPATNAVLAHVAGMDEALYRRTLESSTAAQVACAKMDTYTRCTHLYNLARSVQKHLTSFGEMQSLQSGKVIPVCMEEASQMVRYLYHYAGVAMTLNERFPESTPRGVVVVLLEDVRATCPVSAWRVGEILAAGNSLLIIAKSECSLAPMHFAEMCAAGGLPPGLVNVLVGPFEGILGMDDVGHVHVVASHSRCRELRQSLALKPTTSLSSYWGCGRSIAVVLEGADLHSAAAGIGQSFANSSGRGEACGVQVFVQECVYAEFMPLLRKELRTLRVGAANDRTSDMSVVFAQGEPTPLPPKVAYAELPDAELLSAGPYDDKHPYPPRPALFADVTPSSPVVLYLVGWPLVLVTQFRTAKESVTLVNSALHHSEVSVWTERRTEAAVSVALNDRFPYLFSNNLEQLLKEQGKSFFPNLAYMALTRSQARKLSQELDLVQCGELSSDLVGGSTEPQRGNFPRESCEQSRERPVAEATGAVSLARRDDMAPLNQSERGATLSPVAESRSKLSRVDPETLIREQHEDLSIEALVESHKNAAQVLSKEHYEKSVKKRVFEVGSQIMLLQPSKKNKLEVHWEGPTKVSSKLSDTNYGVKLGRQPNKIYNLMKPYVQRQAVVNQLLNASEEEEAEIFSSCEVIEGGSKVILEQINLEPRLSEVQKEDMRRIVFEFGDVFSDHPGNTRVIEHGIVLTGEESIRSKPYRCFPVQRRKCEPLLIPHRYRRLKLAGY